MLVMEVTREIAVGASISLLSLLGKRGLGTGVALLKGPPLRTSILGLSLLSMNRYTVNIIFFFILYNK